MQVLITTKYGNLWRWAYEIGVTCRYTGFVSQAVISNEGNGEYVPVHFPRCFAN